MHGVTRQSSSMSGVPARASMPAACGSGSATAVSLCGLRVLVVDDSDINRELAACILRADGARVAMAENGQSAIDWLLQHKDDVDLVLMDVQMPVLDGCQATRCIRDNPGLAQLPVMGLTGGQSTAQVEAAQCAGMNAVLGKPLTVEQLKASICSLLLRQGSAVPQPVEAEPDATETILDRRRGLRLWGNLLHLDCQLHRFGQQYRQAESVLGTLLRAQQHAAAIAHLHKLKGSAGAVALSELFHCAGRLEQRLRRGESWEFDWGAFTAALARALDLIDHLPAPASEGPVPTSLIFDPNAQAEVLQHLLAALQTEVSDEIEEALQATERALGSAALRRVRQLLESFDLPAAEQLVASWLSTQDLPFTGESS